MKTIFYTYFINPLISLEEAEIGIGVSGALHMLDASGAETTRQSGEVNKGSSKKM